MTAISPGASLKKRAAAPTASPESFMKDCGFGGGSSGCGGCWCGGLFFAHHGRRRDRGDREVAFGDRRDGSLGQFHLVDMNAVADIDPLEIDGQVIGDIVGTADQIDLVA